MFRILKKSLKTGIVTGTYPRVEASSEPVRPAAREKAALFRRSLTIREVDTGSCNACEMEMNALANPVYDAERFGLHIAASPRHADALVVTGPVTINMERALKDAYKQTPDPKIVIALGDCAIDCGLFKGSYAVTGPVDRHIPVDVRIPGCPPRPAEILAALAVLREKEAGRGHEGKGGRTPDSLCITKDGSEEENYPSNGT
jgi:Ni,Fe-hydrogenase III small subunit